MNALDAWRSRPLTVRTLVRCDRCETLQEDVKPRTSAWVPTRTICCDGCFTKLVAAAQNLIAC
jgi:hypothetical protein